MLRWLRIFFVEQTTPDEMIVFPVVCVVLALLFAILLYALIFLTARIVGAASAQTITVAAGRAYTVRLQDPIG